jgi:hypothetical protein
MNHLATLLRHLEAYVQEEIGAQGRTLALLEAQERAVGACDRQAIERSTRSLDVELRQAAVRARRRGLLLEGFGKLWELDASTLSLASLIERVGPDADRLQRQRAELRDASAKVRRRARRIGSAARAHQRLTAEIIETVLTGAAEGAGLEAGGTLVNAEA